MALRALTGNMVLCSILLLTAGALPAAEKPSEEFVQLIIKLIGNDDREFRAAGLEQVRTAARSPEVTKLFAAQLTKPNADGQVALLTALGDRGDAAARPAVLDLFASSKDESVRAAALGALGKIGTLDDLGVLIKALDAGSAAEQSAAQISLTQVSGEKINGAIADESTAGLPAVRATLIHVLATRRAGDMAPTLVAAAIDGDAQVRRAAMSALGEIGRPEQIPQMLPGVLKAERGAERDEAERDVAQVCSRIDNEAKRGDALIAALKTVDEGQRDQLLSLIGRVGGPTLIHFVADIATGKDKARRRLGIDALSKWPDASVADTLFEIASNANDPAERSQAFQGFVKVSATRDDRPDDQRLARMKQAMQAAKTPEETTAVIMRTRTSYHIDALRFVLPYVEQPKFAQMACETIVEISHHREVRDPNKAEVDKMLDKVIQTSKDEEVVERANRYKKGQTWTRRARK